MTTGTRRKLLHSFLTILAICLVIMTRAGIVQADTLPGPAPSVTANDITNRVYGMATSMEYNLDSAGYVGYSLSSFDTVSFSGNHVLLVRYKATADKPASDAASLSFTANPAAPATPGVRINDRLNTVYGMTTAMEYSLDAAAYVSYDPAVFSAINFAGSHTLLVRYKLGVSFLQGDAISLTFTANPKTAKVVFTFDDGWLDTYTQAFPILKAAGYKGTVYVCRDIALGTGADMMRTTQISALNRMHWDISNHTTNHAEIGDQTTPESLALLKTMYQDNMNWIIGSFGTRGAFNAAYPSGKYSTQLISILKNLGLTTGRLAETEASQPTPVTNPDNYFLLPVFPLESTSSANPEDSPVTIATNAITAATASGDTVIFMIHKVESTISDLVLTSADFQAIVDYVRARPDQVEVMSLSDWYTKASPTANTPPAPNVALNDATNTVTGMAAGMEYNLDGTGYVAYDAGVFSALNLTGRHVLLVRQAAASPIPAGLPKVLIFTADPGAAKIVFTFSDGAQGIVDNALPILQAADFQGTAYVSRDIIGTSPSIMDSTDLNTLSLAGWDISNRPYNNSDVSGLTSEQIQTLFSENRTWLVGNGWTTGANEACYSGTYADPVYQALSALGMHTGVTVLDTAEGLVGTPLGAADEYFRLPVYNVYNGNDYYINRVKAAIDNAVLDGKTVILSIYDVQPGAPTTGGSVLSSAALTDIVNYAKGYANAGQISCVTMSAWYAAQP